MSFIPNLITLLNLCSGCLAIVFAVDGNPGLAAIAVLAAAIFDFFDGFAARMLKAHSEIGRELDSLADVVSFGVAPAMILLTLMELALFGENVQPFRIKGSLTDWMFLAVSLIIPAFSAYRLAKFNTDTRQTVNFLGMPTPANAMLWASFGLMTAYSGNEELLEILFTPGNLAVTAIVTSLLLVSEIPMFSLKFSGTQLRANWYRYMFLGVAAALIAINWVTAPALIVVFYVALSVSFYLLKIEY